MAQITLTIHDSKLEEFKTAYFRRNRLPLDPDGQPIVAELAWIKKCVINSILAEYQSGKQLLAQDGVVMGADLIS